MKKWLLWGGVLMLVVAAGAVATGYYLSKRFQPFIREQAIRYLEERFNSDVELAAIKIAAPVASFWNIQATPLRVTGDGLVLRYRDRPDLAPLIKVRHFEVHASLRTLWESPRRIGHVKLDGLEVNVPSKANRQSFPAGKDQTSSASSTPRVLADKITAADSALRIYPNQPEKPPREFLIHSVTLTGAGAGGPLHYIAKLTNPKPAGIIDTEGDFGPWKGDDPSLTPIAGRYSFKDADLGVFKSIAGILQSEGTYSGPLERIEVRGQTSTPDFRLTVSGNPVPLTTNFVSVVDGTSGDTLLQPVRATLGRTHFVASGGVVRRPGDKARTITLDVLMPSGRIEDLLRLAMKGSKPVMTGAISLRTKMEIQPKELATLQRLLLDGTFTMAKSQFLNGSVQDKIDSLSRRAQGRPKDEQIDDVLSAIRGAFRLRNGEINFSGLSFQVPGAAVDLAGRYDIYDEQMDFRGSAKLQARVSQTMTGWKRWALKPVDPFFSKNGAGTFLPIKITGSRDKPEFGLDRKKEKPEPETRSRKAKSD